MRRLLAAAMLLVAFDSSMAEAPEEPANQIAFTLGRTFIGNQSVANTSVGNNVVRAGRGLSFDFAYARQLKRLSFGSLALELPVVFDPDEDLSYGANQVPLQYSSFFVSPSARLNLAPDPVISPWLSFGGGLAHFQGSKELLFGGTNPGPRVNMSSALQFGAGFDLHVPWKYSRARLRVEFRDNWTGEPPLRVITGSNRQHNYYIGGGIVYGF
ncbi:MAG: hypothetical protein JO356_05710 [Acidobacteria bacterium]|nr:hypothetical protein [Acidobacteriota bacterium]